MDKSELSSVQITKEASKRLREIAEYLHRSKTQQIEWWIELEHRRIFCDGERASMLIPAESIPMEQQP